MNASTLITALVAAALTIPEPASPQAPAALTLERPVAPASVTFVHRAPGEAERIDKDVSAPNGSTWTLVKVAVQGKVSCDASEIVLVDKSGARIPATGIATEPASGFIKLETLPLGVGRGPSAWSVLRGGSGTVRLVTMEISASFHLLFDSPSAFRPVTLSICSVTGPIESAVAASKPDWTIVAAKVQRYTMSDRKDGVDPIVREGTIGLRILMTARYEGAGLGLPPPLTVIALPSATPLHVPGNVSVSGLTDVDAMVLFMDGVNKGKEPRAIKPGRVFGVSDPIAFYAVDVPPEVGVVRITFGDSAPQDVKVVPTPSKQ